MSKRTTALILLALAANLASGQTEKPQPAFGISFSGFIKTDIIYDSRQTTSIREGHFLLFPKGEQLDRAGKDINAAANFNILSVQTRLAGKVTGPDALGAKTSGLIEGEFFGTADGDTNGFRLRHAYVKLNWKKSELMIGQFWHAMFITDCYPDVVSFNTGAPFQPFSRAPQVRFTQAFGKLSLIATALSQRDFTSNGPEGVSSVYIRNAARPEFNLKAQFGSRDEKAGTETLFGFGVDAMRIAPRLVTEARFKADESVDGIAIMAYGKRRMPGWTIKAESVYGQNLHHLTMLGGYGVERVTDPVRRTQKYTPLDTLSFWAEAHTNSARWQAGLFGGYARNLGSRHVLTGPAYARGGNIRNVFRVSPRLIFNSAKLRLAAEVELTSAGYGTPDAKGKVRDARVVSNVRLLLATYYFF
jgi:hypothetical protein